MLRAAGNKLFNVEAHAFVLEMRKAGILVDLVPTDAATILARLKRGDFDLVPMTWEGRPTRIPAPLYGAAGPFNYSGYRSSALDALLDEARARRGPGGAPPDPGPHRAPPRRRPAGDLPLSLRCPGAGLHARPRLAAVGTASISGASG